MQIFPMQDETLAKTASMNAVASKTILGNQRIMKEIKNERDSVDESANTNINISKNICVGLILSGCLSYFSEDERKNDKSIIHLEEKLANKLTPFRNGTLSFRDKILKAKAKKKLSSKDKENIKTLNSYNQRFVIHSDIANRAWVRLQDDVKENRLTINHLITSMLHQLPITSKYYSFSIESLDKLKGNGEGKVGHGYAFSSLKVANKLLAFLDEEIAEYEKNNDVPDERAIA
jgi:hypothetical protein